VRVLHEVRRLLRIEASEPLVQAEVKASDEVGHIERDTDSNELHIQTRYGLWKFRPPFDLEEDEVGLIRLVAGEDEITAEQIKRKTGRRRSVDDLDELLDRLLTEGMEPIKESNDRYGFDPDFLQD